MKIAIASDHAGFRLKDFLKESLDCDLTDYGAHTFDPDDDYPDFIIPAAESVRDGINEKAIVIGGSGQGEAIAANKVRGVRAIVFNGQYEKSETESNPDEIIISREHNYANVLSLGARFMSNETALDAVQKWLSIEPGKEERHIRRIGKIAQYEKHGKIS
jgi:ribose 5-phosphate isomerase B